MTGGDRSVFAGIVCAAALVLPVQAQESGSQVEQVTVTGTRIGGDIAGRISPVVVLDSSDLKLGGLVRVEDALNQLPQVFADQSSTVNNGAIGTATANLRDLQPERTLVLIDGKRLMPGDPTSGSVAPDLNFIPTSLVERIEVLTGGASAVYGSDAVAGVVNFIMRRDFTGLELDAEAGAYSHDNDETALHAALARQGDPQAPATVTDGLAWDTSLVAGTNTSDGNGNLTVYAGYRRAQPISQATRDFSACPVAGVSHALGCTGSDVSTFPGQFFVINPATFNLASDLTLDSQGPGNTVRPYESPRDAFNYAPFQYFQRDDTRYTAGAFAHYALFPEAELYADAMFMQDMTTSQVAPSGLFANALYDISCDNPMLSPEEVQNFCTDVGTPRNGDALIAIGRRDVEASKRRNYLTHTDYRLVGGVRGNFDGWHYDLSAQYGTVTIESDEIHDVSLTRAAEALDVVRNAAGDIVCASGASGCVPYDVFKIGGVTKAALAYIDAAGRLWGGTSETMVSANLGRNLGAVQSPWASNPAALALGAEYRREGLDYRPDAEYASGDLASVGMASPPVNGMFDVKEGYGEVQLPLVQDRTLVEDFTLDGGYRYSWYSNAGEAATYKADAAWSPVQSLTLRSGFNHAVRAPNADELFTPQTEDQFELAEDPCAGPNPVAENPLATKTNCARTGVTAAEYGNITVAPGGYNTVDGGNPDLRPEKADTLSAGAVWAPVSGNFSLAVDYFDILIAGAIQQIDPAFTLDQCLASGNATFCNLIHRAPRTGSLWLTPQGYVSNIEQNSASLSTQGVDVDFSYTHDLPRWDSQALGSLGVHLLGTYLTSLRHLAATGAQGYDCVGSYGEGHLGSCGDPAPRWRHMMRATWTTPWNLDASIAWQYVGATSVAASSPNPALTELFAPADLRLGARSYFDLSFACRIDPQFDLRFGINNVFDTDPPIVGSGENDFIDGVAANGNTYPGVYDALGRWIFVGLTARE